MKTTLFSTWLTLLMVTLTPLTWSQQVIQEGPEVVAQLGKPPLLVLKPTAQSSFRQQENVIQELYDLLLFDLRFSDAFTVYEETPQAAYLNRQDRDSNSFDYDQWSDLKFQDRSLDYVVKTELIPRDEDQFQLNLRVYDLVQKERPIGRAFGAEPHPPFSRELLRRAGHRATALIISTLSDIEPITETRLCFVNHNKSKRTKELYLIDYDGWSDSLVQITTFNSVTIFPDWSPDGKKIAYVSYKNNNWPDCYIQNLSNGEIHTLARFKGTNTTPRWFPDNQHLAISLSAEGNSEIYKIQEDGKNPVRLTHHSAIEQAPDVSPDGDTLVFTSDRTGDRPQIYTMDLEGGNERRISYVENGRRKCDTPMWSPRKISRPKQEREDYRIAFCGFFDSLTSDIYTCWPDGSDLERLTDEAGENQNPTWSPNGKYIAFSSNRLGKSEIFIMPSDPNKTLYNGKRFYRVTHLSGENLSPAWSPN